MLWTRVIKVRFFTHVSSINQFYRHRKSSKAWDSRYMAWKMAAWKLCDAVLCIWRRSSIAGSIRWHDGPSAKTRRGVTHIRWSIILLNRLSMLSNYNVWSTCITSRSPFRSRSRLANGLKYSANWTTCVRSSEVHKWMNWYPVNNQCEYQGHKDAKQTQVNTGRLKFQDVADLGKQALAA